MPESGSWKPAQAWLAETARSNESKPPRLNAKISASGQSIPPLCRQFYRVSESGRFGAAGSCRLVGFASTWVIENFDVASAPNVEAAMSKNSCVAWISCVAWRLVLAAAAVGAANEAAAQYVTMGGGSAIRPGALDSIPRRLSEIGWDTDLPSLFVIRFQPEKTNFAASWSSWASAEFMQERGFMSKPKTDPWPSIFVSGASLGMTAAGALSTEDMQVFQAWCLRRSQVIPPIVVQSVPYVASISSGEPAVLRPFGLRAKQQRSNQIATGVGFSEMVGLALSVDADDFAAVAPPEVLAALPASGVSLETRVSWETPYPNTDEKAMNVELIIPVKPVSLRLVDSHRRVLWEHRFGPGADNSAPASAPERRPIAAPAPTGTTPDIKF